MKYLKFYNIYQNSSRGINLTWNTYLLSLGNTLEGIYLLPLLELPKSFTRSRHWEEISLSAKAFPFSKWQQTLRHAFILLKSYPFVHLIMVNAPNFQTFYSILSWSKFHIFMQLFLKVLSGMANIVDPYQTAPVCICHFVSNFGVGNFRAFAYCFF